MPVAVISKTGERLMPTSEHRARKLLKSGKAIKYSYHPFTIQLTERESGDVQPMWDLLDLAAKDTACAAKVWDCFVNRDTEAKKWIKNVCDITGWGEVDER